MGEVKIEEEHINSQYSCYCRTILSLYFQREEISRYTSRNYQHAIYSFFDWLSKSKKDLQIHQIGRFEARSYLIEIQAKLAKTTIRNHFSALKGLFRFTHGKRDM